MQVSKTVRHIPCGPLANESERVAIERLRNKLASVPGPWVLLSNLHHSSNGSYFSDEVDLIAIGPQGVFVIEIKHWDSSYLKEQSQTVIAEAEKVNDKAKRIAGKLRKRCNPGFVGARMLLTKGELNFSKSKEPFTQRGVPFFGLPEWSDLLATNGKAILTAMEIDQIAKELEPSIKISLSGELRTFAGLINLELLSSKEDRLHRIYRGIHASRRDRVFLHLYDLSATDEKQSLNLVRREYEVLQRWQKSRYLPGLLDSFQDAPAYPGELCFFTIIDPAAPALSNRSLDDSWTIDARIRYAESCLAALADMHQPAEPGLEALVHRNINPLTLRVRHDGEPLFTDFRWTRLAYAQTISAVEVDFGEQAEFIAPEVHEFGLSIADAHSDTYALCASLLTIFTNDALPLDVSVRAILSRGVVTNKEARPSLTDLRFAIQGLGHDAPQVDPKLPPAEYWDEDTIIPFQQSRYKVVSRLGSGGVGQTFKVVELDGDSDEKFGTYVAKIIRHKLDGEQAIRAYRKVRAHSTHPNLAFIHEIAPEWSSDRFVALMKWVEGMPLADLTGIVQLYAEELNEASPEGLVLRWLKSLCEALASLHQVGLIHGDVSPRNLIVHGGIVTLTDFDNVTTTGDKPRGGTHLYTSPNVQGGHQTYPVDDFFALAASLFHVVFDQDPFLFGAERAKNRGLNWSGVQRETWPLVAEFLDLATSPDSSERFVDGAAALSAIERLTTPKIQLSADASTLPLPTVDIEYLPRRVDRLTRILESYPGSQHGNIETRGLDSAFASDTYVETRLDSALINEIRDRKVNFVILFGNAGDGKTAFLQHLAQKLGLERVHSSKRIWEHRLENGMKLHANLDCSASYQGKSASELIDKIFRPFHEENFSPDILNIAAINSGKLKEWLDAQPEVTYLTRQLSAALAGNITILDPRFRFIDLNVRSLVGGIDLQSNAITTDFFDQLLDRLLGAKETDDPWKDCSTCTAQSRCAARASVVTLRDAELGPRVRTRLKTALQAVHQRGEIHITTRELKAALSYIFFDIYSCDNLHANVDRVSRNYASRIFDAESAYRQGELLAELARLDPALEAHPNIDRHLLRQLIADGVREMQRAQGLREARRSAFLNWPDSQIIAVGGSPDALTLARGKHLMRFARVPLMSDHERSLLCRDLCAGMARLEELPPLAFREDDGIPLRITPRTPTESAFWVIKPFAGFKLSAPLPETSEGLEALHTHLRLEYRYLSGEIEFLLMGAELFHTLLELKDGAQIAGVAAEDLFAQLAIFTQRLAQEDRRRLCAWNPLDEGKVFRIGIEMREAKQVLICATEDIKS